MAVAKLDAADLAPVSVDHVPLVFVAFRELVPESDPTCGAPARALPPRALEQCRCRFEGQSLHLLRVVIAGAASAALRPTAWTQGAVVRDVPAAAVLGQPPRHPRKKTRLMLREMKVTCQMMRRPKSLRSPSSSRKERVARSDETKAMKAPQARDKGLPI